MSDPKSRELGPESLRWTCDPAQFSFESAEELPAAPGIIGQDRAIDAIRLGMSIRSKGHNVFVAGPSGTGRATTARHLLETADTGRKRAPRHRLRAQLPRSPTTRSPSCSRTGRARAPAEMDEFVVAMRRGDRADLRERRLQGADGSR